MDRVLATRIMEDRAQSRLLVPEAQMKAAGDVTPAPAVAVTLTHRTQSPVVTEFIATAREVAQTFFED